MTSIADSGSSVNGVDIGDIILVAAYLTLEGWLFTRVIWGGSVHGDCA